MQAILNIAIRAARKAGAYVIRERELLDRHAPEKKITDLQANAETIMVEIIAKAHPEHSISAASLPVPESMADIVWHLEVVNGVGNLQRNIPHYAIVITIEKNQKAKYCLVYDLHCNETFTASAGGGAQVNTYKVRVNNCSVLDDAVLATTHLSAQPSNNCSALKQLNLSSVTFYNQGCDALSLAYVAAGRIDGFFGKVLSKTVLQAGVLLAKESGALATDLSGGLDYLAKGELLVSNPKLFKVLLKQLKY